MRGLGKIAIVVPALGLVAVAAGAALPSPSRQGAGADSALLSVHGQLRVTNDRAGRYAVRARRFKPGTMTRGLVHLGYHGPRAGHVYADVDLGSGKPGPNGGQLGEALRLRLVLLQQRDRRTIVYAGPPRDATAVPLPPRWRPGATRTYSVRVRFPNGGRPPSATRGDNAYQASRTEFGLVWRAVEIR